MNSTLILGLQWGDEGKGKIVDALCKEGSLVCRFQGGHNAGQRYVRLEIYKLVSLLYIEHQQFCLFPHHPIAILELGWNSLVRAFVCRQIYLDT